MLSAKFVNFHRAVWQGWKSCYPCLTVYTVWKEDQQHDWQVSHLWRLSPDEMVRSSECRYDTLTARSRSGKISLPAFKVVTDIQVQLYSFFNLGAFSNAA
jgi:hypothetical protein